MVPRMIYHSHIYFIICVCMCVCHVYEGLQGFHKLLELLGLLELELQEVVSCLIWVLGNKPRSSGRAVNVLSLQPHILGVMIYLYNLKVPPTKMF